jgi:hypothetical protein
MKTVKMEENPNTKSTSTRTATKRSREMKMRLLEKLQEQNSNVFINNIEARLSRK